MSDAQENVEATLSTEYLLIEPYPLRTTKTGYWKITNRTGEFIGMIKWHTPWRRYCFTCTGQVILDAYCMQVILKFVIDRMNERKGE